MNPSASTCDGCGSLSLIIHNVRQRAINRRYCTNCLLNHHRGSFCPICFDLFDDPLQPHLRLMCSRCPNFVHRSCAFPSPTDSTAPPPRFLCRTCADPDFSYFKLPDPKSGAVDVQSARVLVTAARIAAASMTRAAAAARFDAERRAKEAAAARKKAREALEHLADMVAKEKEALVEERGVSAKNAGLHVTK